METDRLGRGDDRQAGHRGGLSQRSAGNPLPWVELAYRTFDKIRQVLQAAIVENKQLGAALAFIREEQLPRARVAQHPSTAPARSARRASFQGWLNFLRAKQADARSVKKRVRLDPSVLPASVGRCATPGTPRPPAARPQRTDICILRG